MKLLPPSLPPKINPTHRNILIKSALSASPHNGTSKLIICICGFRKHKFFDFHPPANCCWRLFIVNFFYRLFKLEIAWRMPQHSFFLTFHYRCINWKIEIFMEISFSAPCASKLPCFSLFNRKTHWETNSPLDGAWKACRCASHGDSPVSFIWKCSYGRHPVECPRNDTRHKMLLIYVFFPLNSFFASRYERK